MSKHLAPSSWPQSRRAGACKSMESARSSSERFERLQGDPPVRGYLHRPAQGNGGGLVLAHGAGSNANAPLLINVAETFANAGYIVLRCDLPFRQEGRTGPPRPGDAERDRRGLKQAVAATRELASGRVFLGGHSYGGRQATMLCAEEPALVSGLLLLSYPLHPPRKPEQLRVAHLPKLTTPALFVHGTRDPFGSIAEMEQALECIPGWHRLLAVEGAGHDLGGSKKVPGLRLEEVLEAFEGLMTPQF
jgi:predicted alpha/beta-hydrolase family hydrolase